MSNFGQINKFKDQVWFTRKAWINAEDRLLKNDFHTQLLMVVYAAYSSCISVVLLKYDPKPADKNLIDCSLAVLSIILLALSLYLNTKSFKDRAIRFKNGYLDLHKIYTQLEMLDDSKLDEAQQKKIENLHELYSKALREVENHSELDDIRARYLARSTLTSRKLSFSEELHFWCWRIYRFLILVTAYVAPFVAILWYWLQ